jgi:hypothetical protein
MREAAALGADLTIPLVEDQAALDASFAAAFDNGVDFVIDYLWGRSAERLLIAAANAGKALPVRFVQIGSGSGATIARKSNRHGRATTAASALCLRWMRMCRHPGVDGRATSWSRIGNPVPNHVRIRTLADFLTASCEGVSLRHAKDSIRGRNRSDRDWLLHGPRGRAAAEDNSAKYFALAWRLLLSKERRSNRSRCATVASAAASSWRASRCGASTRCPRIGRVC